MKRITPENITKLTPKMVVLVGTNESGIHGAGIAHYACSNWGLEPNKGYGPSGYCFGLPTKDWNIRTLPLDVIENYVERYRAWVLSEVKKEHYVTKIGCGLAGYSVPDIAPMFHSFRRFTHVWMPQDFLDFYDGTYKPPTDESETHEPLLSGDGKA